MESQPLSTPAPVRPLRLVRSEPLPDSPAALAGEAANLPPRLSWVCDAQMRPLFFDSAWMDFTGRRDAAAPWIESVHPEDREAVQESFLNAVTEQQPFTIRHRLGREDGRFSWVLSHGSPLFSGSGAFSGFIVNCMELPLADAEGSTGDGAAAGERAERALSELAARTRDLDDVAHVASHDLKEPLRGIHSHAAFALEDAAGSLSRATEARLVQIQQLARRAESLIDAILHIAHAGRSPMRALPTNLQQLVAQVTATLQPFLEKHQATVEIQRSLPEVLCHPPWIAEVFAHLLVNAVKFNEQEQRHIRISWEPSGDNAVILVEDNGIGIPDRHREAVFKLCKRLHQRDRYGGGIGSGLTLCRRILERHGGTIWLEPGESGGTRVLFTLAQHREGVHGRR